MVDFTRHEITSFFMNGPVNFFIYGERGGGPASSPDPERRAKWEALPEAVRDGMVVEACVHQCMHGIGDWLAGLKYATEKNQQELLRVIVNEMQLENPALPLWLLDVCRYAEERGWTIWEEWVEDLHAATNLGEHYYSLAKSARRHPGEAREWLTKYKGEQVDAEIMRSFGDSLS